MTCVAGYDAVYAQRFIFNYVFVCFYCFPVDATDPEPIVLLNLRYQSAERIKQDLFIFVRKSAQVIESFLCKLTTSLLNTTSRFL